MANVNIGDSKLSMNSKKWFTNWKWRNVSFICCSVMLSKYRICIFELFVQFWGWFSLAIRRKCSRVLWTVNLDTILKDSSESVHIIDCSWAALRKWLWGVHQNCTIVRSGQMKTDTALQISSFADYLYLHNTFPI